MQSSPRPVADSNLVKEADILTADGNMEGVRQPILHELVPLEPSGGSESDYEHLDAALQSAVENGRTEDVRQLLELDANPFATLNDQSAIALAFALDQSEQIKDLLLQYEDDLGQVIRWAAQCGSKSLKEALEKWQEARDILTGPAADGNVERVRKLLLDELVPLGPSGGRKSRAEHIHASLQSAVKKGHCDIASLLIEYNADPIYVLNNQTALELAFASDHSDEMTELLLKKEQRLGRVIEWADKNSELLKESLIQRQEEEDSISSKSMCRFCDRQTCRTRVGFYHQCPTNRSKARKRLYGRLRIRLRSKARGFGGPLRGSGNDTS